ncbi:MAG: type IV secretory system conjugative DNA transfer family protein, partial [Gammaproteobacteria bacterium]
MNQKFVFISILFMLLTGCSSHRQDLDNVDTANLNQLEHVRVHPTIAANNKSELSGLRLKSLKDSAMSIGAQGGLAWASEKINLQLNIDSKYLETIFNFNAMVLSHG